MEPLHNLLIEMGMPYATPQEYDEHFTELEDALDSRDIEIARLTSEVADLTARLDVYRTVHGE